MNVPRRRATDSGGLDFSPERRTEIIDPTENVKALNTAANARQDDLRHSLSDLFNQHLTMLEKSIDARFGEVRELVHTHNAADKDAFEALRRELNQHNVDDTREHAQILNQSSERMVAMKDLLSASIDGVNRSNGEVKKNVEELRAQVILNQNNGVSTDTYNEFKRGVEAREKIFNDYMLSNQGERTGIKNFWGLIVGAAVGSAALVSVISYITSRLH